MFGLGDLINQGPSVENEVIEDTPTSVELDPPASPAPYGHEWRSISVTFLSHRSANFFVDAEKFHDFSSLIIEAAKTRAKIVVRCHVLREMPYSSQDDSIKKVLGYKIESLAIQF